MIVARPNRSLGSITPIIGAAGGAGFLALSTTGRKIVEAITDLPAQRDRINAEWSAFNGIVEGISDVFASTGTRATPQLDAGLAAWRNRIQEADDANALAARYLSTAIAAAYAAGRGAGLPMPGLGNPVAIVAVGIAGAVLLVGGGFVAVELYNAYTDAEIKTAQAQVTRQANKQVLDQWVIAATNAVSSGQPIPEPPNLVKPPEKSASTLESLVTTLAFAGVAIGGLYALGKFVGRPRS